MITYVGNCGWELSEKRAGRRIMDIPSTRYLFRGRVDQAAAFAATKQIGTQYDGGFIVDVGDVQPEGPFAELEITVLHAPDFSTYTVSTSRMIQTASRGATVTASGIIPDETEIEANRTMSFISPQTTFTYFAPARPEAPRFTNPIERSTPILLRSVITATANGKSRTYYGTAPGVLIGALAMPAQGLITGFTADQIEGTPWYRCTDTISWSFRGDEV